MLGKIVYKIKKKIFPLVGAFDTSKDYTISKNYSCLKGKVVVVTGGSGHIGRSIVCKLAAEGAIVYVCGTNNNRVNSVVEEVTSKLKGIAYPIILNVMDASNIEKVFNDIIDKENRIDILVNCAGGGSRGSARNIVDQYVDVIDDVLNLNLRGSILCVRAVAPIMRERGWGRIIDIGSAVATGGLCKYSEYAAAKAGCIAFVRSVAMELGKYGITANCVSPGKVQRGLMTEDIFNKIKKTNWLNSYGTAEDISEMVAYLCSDKARFITGQNFIVDGGRSLGLKGE